MEKADPRLYKVTIKELVLLVGWTGSLTKKDARAEAVNALRTHDGMETGLDKVSMTVKRVTKLGEIPRGWKYGIPFGENFHDASAEDIVEGKVYDEEVEKEYDKDGLIERLREQGKISRAESKVLKG